MWRLLEARLRPQVPVLAAAILAGVLASLPLMVRYAGLRATPERLACLAGIVILFVVTIYRWAQVSRERRESRLALLVTLPLPLGRLALSQVLEPIAAPLAVAGLALTTAVLGRFAVGGDFETLPLWMLVITVGYVLAFEQLLLLGDQLYAHWPDRLPWPRWMLGFSMAVGCLAGLVIFLGQGGIFPDLEALRPHVLTGRSLGTCLAVAGALAMANRRLFLSRPQFLN